MCKLTSAWSLISRTSDHRLDCLLLASLSDSSRLRAPRVASFVPATHGDQEYLLDSLKDYTIPLSYIRTSAMLAFISISYSGHLWF